MNGCILQIVYSIRANDYYKLFAAHCKRKSEPISLCVLWLARKTCGIVSLLVERSASSLSRGSRLVLKGREGIAVVTCNRPWQQLNQQPSTFEAHVVSLLPLLTSHRIDFSYGSHPRDHPRDPPAPGSSSIPRAIAL